MAGYAGYYIQRRIFQLIDNNKLLKFPETYNSHIKFIEDGLKNNKDIDDLAKELGISGNKAKDLLESKDYKYVSLYAENDDGETFERAIPDAIKNNSEDLFKLINKLITNELSKKQQEVIIKFYGFDSGGEEQYNAEIGRNLGLSRERVRQINVEACKILRAALKSLKITKEIALS